MHYAACIAGMAMSNAFLGCCHSLAHVLGARYHVPHGLANAALISHTIRFNSSDKPFKVGGSGWACVHSSGWALLVCVSGGRACYAMCSVCHMMPCMHALHVATRTDSRALMPPLPQVTSFPSYRYPHAKGDYAEIADQLKLGGDTLDEKVCVLLVVGVCVWGRV